jgi:subtilase family serine protease
MQFCQKLVIFCLVFLGALSGRAAERQVLTNHVPAAVKSLAPVDRLPASQRLHLAINLPLRDRDSLNKVIGQLYDPSSPSFHHFLTSDQFTEAFGPTKKDYVAVANFARSRGLTITGTRSNRTLVEVDGSVADIEKAFHVNMLVYPHPAEHRNFFAPDSEPSLDLDVPVLAIAGLTDYLKPHPASIHVRPVKNRPNLSPQAGSDGGMYIGQDFRGAYAAGVTNTGTGQSVGLVEFDSYYPGDISSYINTTQSGLAGSSVALSNVVLGGLSGPPGSDNVEVALDIEMAISMAPGLSTIYIYEATNNGAESDVVLSRMASDNLSRQLSCSWTGFEDAGTDQAFIEFAAQGQSFFQSSGDSGAYIRRGNPVEPPSDSTNVTSVGGTTLSTTGPHGNWQSETTWSWFTTPESGLDANATSGGTSTTWPLPPWQAGISMTANQGSTSFRNLPDVAMVANQIFLIANNGGNYFAGGTSAAAPLWAGLTALLNQQLASQSQPALGFLNPALYAIGKGANYSACFHDTTVGNNTNSATSTKFFATAGYDLCTGWGTPIGSALISVLSPEPLQIVPSAVFGSSGSYGGPFSATSWNFVLTNAAAASFNWSVSFGSPWLSASSSSGTLVSGGVAATVTVSLNSAANSLAVGSYTNTVTFKNLNDAVTQTFQFVLTVSTTTPVLTWTNPAAITYGATLGATQLDAAANVPGGFAYNPPSGQTLNAGTNTLSVVFTPTDSVDYSGASTSVSLVVSPAPLTVTAASASRPAGQANPVFTGGITGVTNGDDITAAYSCAATASSPAGTYPITPTLVDPNDRQTNYAVSLIAGTLTVGTPPLVFSWTNPAPIIYGTPLTSNQLNATANVTGAYAYIPTNGTALYAGTNTLSVIFTPNDTVDYSSTTSMVSLIILPAPLTVAAGNTTRTYGQPNPAFTGTITGVTNGDDITAVYNCSAAAGSSVGTYAILPSLVDPNNLETNYAVSITDGTLTVGQAISTIFWTNPAPVIYSTALTSNQLNAASSVPGSFAYAPTNGTVPYAGTNTLSVVFTPADAVDYSNATNTVSLVVSPAQLTVTAASTNRIYGQVNPVFTGEITGVTNGDEITAVYNCSATTGSPVGTYAIVPGLFDPNNLQTNYTVSFTDGTLTVGQATAVITWTNPAPVTYGTAVNSNQLNATANVPGTFAYELTNGTALNTGTNTLSVIFTPADATDYVGASTTVSLVVSPAVLTVKAANANRTYGQANPAFIGEITGVTNGDDITAAYYCSATNSSSPGAYPIIPSLIDLGNRQTNYTVSLVDGTLTVGQAVAAIFWTNPAPIIYGAAITSNELNAAASVPGTFAYIPTNGTVLNAGTNTLSVFFTPSDAVDYSNTTSAVSLVVSTAPLAVTAASTNRTYGQADPIFTGEITGVTNGDNITADYSCAATSGSAAGMYAITPTLVDPDNRQTNYTVTLVDGTLTVGQVVAAVTWSNPAPIVYGAAVTSNQLNATASVSGSFAYTPTNGTVLNPGTNTLSAVFIPTDTNAFAIAPATVSLIVAPAGLTIASGITANSKVYDGTKAATLGFNNVTLTGVVNGDTVSLNTNGYVANFASAGLGNSIAVSVSGLTLIGTDAGNYTLTQPQNLAAAITAPTVKIATALPNIVISWTTNATVFMLEQTASLVPRVEWLPVTNAITASGSNNSVVLTAGGHFQYFQLVAAP